MNDKQAVENQINQLLQKTFEIPAEKLVPEARFYEDLGLDSLDAVDMLVHLEDQLGQRVEAERFVNVRTLSDLYEIAFAVIRAAGQPDLHNAEQLPRLDHQSSPQADL